MVECLVGRVEVVCVDDDVHAFRPGRRDGELVELQHVVRFVEVVEVECVCGGVGCVYSWLWNVQSRLSNVKARGGRGVVWARLVECW